MANKNHHAVEIPIVILAAGASQRFGQDKLVTPVAGKRLIDWSLEAAVASHLGPVLVVTNPDRSLEDLASIVSLIVNPTWHQGLSSSIVCGLNALSTTTSHAAIFTPADQPLLTPEVYLRIAKRFHQYSDNLIVASYDGQPRNPVLIGRELWETASCIQGDIGLSVIARSAVAKHMECGDIASVVDVDRPADLLTIEAVLTQR